MLLLWALGTIERYMKRKTRYIIILSGFLLFCVLAPVILLYVQGITYNFTQNKTAKTGILAIKTDPKGANLLLNDSLKDSTPTSIHFVNPGEYVLRVEKAGYQSWQKRLEVKAGKVTWVNPNPNPLVLYFAEPKKIILNSGIDWFWVQHEHIFALANNQLVVMSQSNPSVSETSTLPGKGVLVLPSPSGAAALVRGENFVLIFDSSNKQQTLLPTSLVKASKITWLNEDTLLSLENGTLYSVAWQTGEHVAVRSHVQSFESLDNLMYSLESIHNSLRLVTFEANNAAANVQVQLENMPNFSHPELLVTKQKQVFILADGTVYKVNSSLTPLRSNVNVWNYNPDDNSLVFASGGELSYYNFFDNQVKLVTRSTKPVVKSLLRSDLATAFILQNDTLWASELDNRDHQNSFALFHSGDLKNFTLDSSGRKLLALDGTNLIELVIR